MRVKVISWGTSVNGNNYDALKGTPSVQIPLFNSKPTFQQSLPVQRLVNYIGVATMDYSCDDGIYADLSLVNESASKYLENLVPVDETGFSIRPCGVGFKTVEFQQVNEIKNLYVSFENREAS